MPWEGARCLPYIYPNLQQLCTCNASGAAAACALAGPGARRARKVLGAAVGDVVAVDGGQHHVADAPLRDGLPGIPRALEYQ
jgi:hypothetical protein